MLNDQMVVALALGILLAMLALMLNTYRRR